MKKIITLAVVLFALAVSVPVYALPLSVKIDMLKTQLVQQLKGKDYTGALQSMQSLRETGAKLPSSFEYFEGKALFESGKQAASYEKFSHYVETKGKRAKYYKEAIAYLIKAEKSWLLFKHVFGGSDDDWAESIVQTADGGFVFAGTTYSKGAGEDDAWVVRMDAQGKVLWDRTFGASVDDRAKSIIQTADGGFVFAGLTGSKGAGSDDAWVVRIDTQGKVLWDRVFGGSDFDIVRSFVQTADGGFAFAGVNKSKGAGKDDAWVVQLTKDGELKRSFCVR